LGCCSRRVRVCVSLSGVLFSVGVCVCVCDRFIYLHLGLLTVSADSTLRAPLSHFAAFNYNGLWCPPSALAVKFVYSDTRACSLSAQQICKLLYLAYSFRPACRRLTDGLQLAYSWLWRSVSNLFELALSVSSCRTLTVATVSELSRLALTQLQAMCTPSASWTNTVS